MKLPTVVSRRTKTSVLTIVDLGFANYTDNALLCAASKFLSRLTKKAMKIRKPCCGQDAEPGICYCGDESSKEIKALIAFLLEHYDQYELSEPW